MNADELREFLSTLPEQFRALPETTRTRLAELQRETEELLAQAGHTYSSLAGRGKRVVDDRVRDVKGTARKARESAEENLDEAAEAVQPLVDQAQEAVTEVRRNVTGRSARRPHDDDDDAGDGRRDAPRAPPGPRAPRPPRRAPGPRRPPRRAASSPAGAPDEVSPAQALAQEREAEEKKAADEKAAAATDGTGLQG